LNKIGRDASLYLVTSIISFGISFIALPIFTRLLSPKEFGAVILFMMTGKMIFGFMNLSLHSANYKFYFDHKKESLNDKFRSIYSSNFFFIVLLFLIIIVITYTFKNLFFLNLNVEYLTKKNLILAITYGFLDYSILMKTTQLTAEKRALNFSFTMIFNSLLNLGLSVFLIEKLENPLFGRVYGILVSQAIILIVLIYLLKKHLTIKLSFENIIKSVRFTLPFYPQMILGLSQSYLDKTLLSQLKGSSSVGYYSIGINFTIILKTIMDSVEKVWSPIFFQKAHENNLKSKKLIIDSFNFLAFMYMFLGLFIIYFSEEAIKLLTTPEYYSAIKIVPVYMFYYFFSIYGYLSMSQLTITENLKFILPGSILGAIANILLNVTLIPEYGVLGASFASCVTSFITQISLFYYGNKYFKLPIELKKIVLIYILLLIHTVIFYVLLSIEINVFFKMIFKISFLLSFLFFGIKLEFISKKKLLRFSKII